MITVSYPTPVIVLMTVSYPTTATVPDGTTITRAAQIQSRYHRLMQPFADLTDAQKTVALHAITGYLAGAVAHGFRYMASELATEALDSALEAAREVQS